MAMERGAPVNPFQWQVVQQHVVMNCEHHAAQPVVMNAGHPAAQPVVVNGGHHVARVVPLIQSRTWRYENAEVGVAILWENGNMISFQSQGYITPWHGRFTHAEITGTIHLLFDCHGDVTRMKSVLLYRTAPLRFEGYDYLGRRIVMTCLDTWTWNGYAWHRVTDLN